MTWRAIFTYNAAVTTCEKGQQPRIAMTLFADMQPHDLAPDVITYNAAISACEKGQQPHTAMTLLADMQGPLGGS